MFRCISRCCVLIALATMMATCGPTVPNIRVWRPWLRSLQADEVKPNARLSTAVEGVSEPLLGNEDLIKRNLKENLDRLLERRGFQIVSDSPDCEVRLSYSVKRDDKLEISASSFATSALGIAVARRVGLLAYESSSSLSLSVEEQIAYVHTFSVEFFGPGEKAVWKGEATWDSRELDVLSSISAPLQLALSGLPTDPHYIPTVPVVKATHALNYYTETCWGKWMSCPALPYSIEFDDKPEYSPAGRKLRPEIGAGTKNIEALAAYVDLITTAEYALPTGIKKWKNPTDIRLWKKAKLGGQYRLGTDGQVANVIIELSGSADGYIVRKAYIATDAQYQAFGADLIRWKQALKDYYDFYED